MKKEKIRKLLEDFHKQSKKEVYSLVRDKSYKKLFNILIVLMKKHFSKNIIKRDIIAY